jgi:hypothetical protein
MSRQAAYRWGRVYIGHSKTTLHLVSTGKVLSSVPSLKGNLKRPTRALVLNESTRCLVESRSIPETMRKSAGSFFPKFLCKIRHMQTQRTALDLRDSQHPQLCRTIAEQDTLLFHWSYLFVMGRFCWQPRSEKRSLYPHWAVATRRDRGRTESGKQVETFAVYTQNNMSSALQMIYYGSRIVSVCARSQAVHNTHRTITKP